MTNTRLARGSLPWPDRRRSAYRGSITTEVAIPAGSKLRITAWPREDLAGGPWLSIELEPYPHGGRVTRDNSPSR